VDKGGDAVVGIVFKNIGKLKLLRTARSVAVFQLGPDQTRRQGDIPVPVAIRVAQ
jgi:hypothetical protein